MFNYERSAKEAIKFIGFPEARMKKIIITGPTGAPSSDVSSPMG